MLQRLLNKKTKKVCPRCGAGFECCSEAKCWCDDEIHLSRESLKKLRLQYIDCLCPKCLREFVEEEKRTGGVLMGGRPPGE